MKNFTLVLAFCGLTSLAIAQPTAPVLLSPADMATSVSTKPLLDWDTLTADSFHIVVSDQMDLSNPIISMMGDSATSYQVDTALTAGTTYYWTIAGMDINGMGDYSDTFSFTVLSLPDDPILKSPSTGSLAVSKTPTLEWYTAAGANQYRLHIAEYTNFGDTIYHAIVSDTVHTVTNTLGEYTVYYWRVIAENNDGLSNWSNFWNFTTVLTGIEGVSRVNLAMNIYPNPSTINTSLSFEMKQAGNANVQVLDISGKTVLEVFNGEAEAGTQNLNINTSSLKSGVYFVQVTVDGAAQMMKLVVN